MISIPNTIPNIGLIAYQYQVDPAEPLSQGTTVSNTVNTKINNATVSISKFVNLIGADLGDEITYTLSLINTGNTPANNVLVTDTIPVFTAFKTNSVIVDNNPITGVDPQTGVLIPTIAVNQTITVSFKVTVLSIPSPNPVINSGTVKYSYTIDPDNPNGKTSFSNTNIVSTTVSHANLTNTKFADKENATVGDIITYTLVIKNTGNTTATCVKIFDTIPNNTSFVENSVFINGFAQHGATPQGGLGLDDIPPNGVITLTFKVKVDTIPAPNPIPNNATTTYEYLVLPDIVKNAGTTSNTVNVQVNRAILQIAKQENKKYLDISDELEYILTVSNIGNVPANNIVVYDTIPTYTKFKAGSVFVGGVNSPSSNPQTGINIPTLNALSTITIAFTVIASTIPPSNPIENQARADYRYTISPCCPNEGKDSAISNSVTADINKAVINSSKYVSKEYADIDEKLLYTLVLTNTGNVSANNILIYDTIPEGTVFDTGSVTINNAVQPAINPQYGIQVPSIGPSSTTTITFRVRINEIPTINPISNQGSGTYQYTVDPMNIDGKTSFILTNNAKTTVSHADIRTSKAVDKQFVTSGEKLTYTINLRNIGNTVANNIVFIDSIPVGTSFVANSVTVDGIVKNGVNPQTGVVVGSLLPSENIIVTFSVIVISIPSSGQVTNVGNVQYSYTVNPDTPNSVSNTTSTNTVSTKVSEAIISNETGSLVKLVNYEYADIGDELTYTINLKNVGNVPANNVVVYDTIPSFTTFVENSVEIEGNKIFGANPQTGIQVASIAPNEEVIVTFKVSVNGIPNPNVINNSSRVKYTFTKDPNSVNGESRENLSNTVKTNILSAIIDNPSGGLIKSTSHEFASIGDIITYSIDLTNKGNTDANNVTLYDAIPAGTTFVKNSVEIDDSPQTGLDPKDGIPLRTIMPGITSKVSFKVTVVTLPSVNPIENTSEVTYNYTSDPSKPNGESARNFSNTVKTQINEAILQAPKTLDKSFATINDTIAYTIRVKNVGNVDANNVVLYDTIPDDTTFVEGSVMINGAPNLAANPENGITLPVITPGSTVIVMFKVKITAVPKINPIINQGYIDYNFISNPNTTTLVNRSIITNTVSTKVNYAIIDGKDKGIIKSSDVDYVKVGDTINYTISLTNTGNTVANNVVLFDSIPDSTTFVKNSVYIDNVQKNNINPTDGITIGNLIPGELRVVRFSVKTVSIPAINPIKNQSNVTFTFVVDPVNMFKASGSGLSNIVDTFINQAYIRPSDRGLIKEVSKDFASTGDVLTYTVTLINTGNVDANNVVLSDTIPVGTQFVPNSVTINGSQNNDSPESGVNIGTIQPQGKVTVAFKVTVVTIPVINPIPNQAKVNYDFTVQPDIINGASDSYLSNIVTTKINEARITNADNGLVKQVNKKYSDLGEILTYSINLKNTGNVPANNVVLFDTIPEGTTFVANSVTVNGGKRNGVNPVSGIQIGSLSPNSSALVTFDILVVSLSKNPIINNAAVEYTFVQNPQTNLVISKRNVSNDVSTQINNATLTPVKYTDRAFADINEVINYTISLTNTGNVLADKVVLFDTIPFGSKIVQNSVFVNGVQKSYSSSNLAVQVGKINPSEVATVTFKIVANSIPVPNPLVNNGIVDYSYTIDPSIPNGASNSSISNNVTTKINTADIKAVKSQSEDFSDINNTVTYTIELTNTGNVDVNNLVFLDTIPVGTSFVPNTVKVNNLNILNANPQTGVSISKIMPAETAVITFNVVVTSIPSINPTINQGYVKYSYIKNPANITGVSKENITNVTKLQINNAKVIQSKYVSSHYADLNDILVYTFTLTNIGNVSANNLVVYDTIPAGTTLVSDIVSVNGVIIHANPQTGINVGVLPPAQTVTVSFQVKINTIPNPNPIVNTGSSTYNYIVNPNTNEVIYSSSLSNIQSSKVNHAELVTQKFSTTPFVDINDEISYTIVLTNIGNVPAANVVVYDTLPVNTSFNSSSLYINGICQPGANPNSGLILNCIYPNEVVTITFKAFVNSLPSDCVPETQQSNNAILPCCTGVLQSNCSEPQDGDCCIYNTALTTYGYIVDPSLPRVECTSTMTNASKVCINTAIIDRETGGLVKSVNKKFADVGETLTYTITLINKGNVVAKDVVVIDTIPSETQLIENSITINGFTSSSNTCGGKGISVGNINPGGKVVVSFDVKVVSIPNTNPICNSALVKYKYQVDPSSSTLKEKSSTSNNACTTINSGSLVSVKAVDKQYVTLNETLNYSFNLKNTGNTPLMNVVLIDTVPEGTTFLQGSIIVNGKPMPAALPSNGINVGNILPQDSVSILFKVKVDSLVNPTLNNNGIINYSYTVDPSVPNGISKKQITNTVSTSIKDAIISNTTGSFKKYTDNNNVDLNDVVHFIISSTNIGTVNAENVLIKDILDKNLSFNKGSIFVNGMPYNSPVDLSYGIPIGTIAPNQSVSIEFDATVVSVPSNALIDNKGTITYTFTKNPLTPNDEERSSSTNTVTIKLNHGEISDFKKTSNINYAVLGDIVSFSITGKNTGNVPVLDLQIYDLLAPQYDFVQDSVQVNGISKLGVNISQGVTVGALQPNSNFEVSFKAKVISIPPSIQIINTAKGMYKYIVDAENDIEKTATLSSSNTVSVRQADLSPQSSGFIKSADKEYVKLNDVITYTIKLENKGNVLAENVEVTDQLQEEIEFVPGSVEINSNPQPADSIIDGIEIDQIKPNEIVIIKFKALVKSLPPNNLISNVSFIKYDFIVDPNKAPVVKQFKSNEVNIIVNSTDIRFNKSVDPSFASLDDVVTYQSVISNLGNTAAMNVLFTDTLPSELEFIPGTVIVNNQNIKNLDPNTGISIGSISPNNVVTLTFKATVKKLPKGNSVYNLSNLSYSQVVNPNEAPSKTSTESNISELIVKSPIVSLVKSSNINIATVGDIIEYKVTISNTGNTEALNLLLVDLLDSNLQFVDGSIAIDGTPIVKANLSKGITIPEVPLYKDVIVTFKAKVISINEGTAKNKANASYNYLVNTSGIEREGYTVSNTIVVTIKNIDLVVKKEANKSVIVLDESILYKITVENNGTIQANNVELIDSIPKGLEFIEGSFTIDGTTVNGVDIRDGVNIGNIPPGSKKVITYEVKAVWIECSESITNYAYVLFTVNVSQSTPVKRVESDPTSVTIAAASPKFKEFTFGKVLEIPIVKPDIEDINDLQADVLITNSYIVNTIKGISADNRRLTGYKLIVNGVITYTAEYTAAVASQSVHSAHWTEKFSTYIIVDEYTSTLMGNVDVDIEDISYRTLSARNIYANIVMNLIVR